MVKQSMDDCKKTLTGLEDVLDGIHEEVDFGPAIIGQAVRTFKLNLKSRKIESLRQQIAAYMRTIQLCLQLITVYATLQIFLF